MESVQCGTDPLTEARECLDMIRHDALNGDVRGTVGYLFGILSDNCLSLEATGTCKEELASLIRYGLLCEAVSHLENAKTHEFCSGYLATDQIDAAIEMAHAATQLTNGPAKDRLSLVPELASLIPEVEAYLDTAMQADEPSGVHPMPARLAPTMVPPPSEEDVSGCLTEGCPHTNHKSCVVALKREEARVRALPAETTAEMGRVSFVGLEAHDPFIRAEVRCERGDDTIQFIVQRQLPADLEARAAEIEAAAMLAPAMVLGDDEIEIVDSIALTTLPPDAYAQRLSEPPPLPTRSIAPQSAEGLIPLQV